MRNRFIIITEGQFNSVINDLISQKLTLSTGDDQKSDSNQSIEKETNISDLKISDKGQQLLNNEIFKKKLDEISKEIGIDKNSIIKLMNHESGLNPSIRNNIGCVGLIQFCPDKSRGNVKTISGVQYNLNDLQNNLPLQMDAIKAFWLEGKKQGKIKSNKDLYTYNLFPIAVGKSEDFVLKTNSMSAQTIAKANPIFNKVLGKPAGTPLTVGDLNRFYEKRNMT